MKKEYIQFELLYDGESQGSYIEQIDQIRHIIEPQLSELSEGDSIKLTKVSMTEEEFTNLPEFEGF